MNKCPYCKTTSNPLRLLWQRPYVCPQCGGRSVYGARWLGLRDLIAPAMTGLSAGLLRDWLDPKSEFIRNHELLVLGGGFVLVVVQIVFWLVLIRWVSGGLTPLKVDNQTISAPATPEHVQSTSKTPDS
jgi:hypothetical protein